MITIDFICYLLLIVHSHVVYTSVYGVKLNKFIGQWRFNSLQSFDAASASGGSFELNLFDGSLLLLFFFKVKSELVPRMRKSSIIIETWKKKVEKNHVIVQTFNWKLSKATHPKISLNNRKNIPVVGVTDREASQNIFKMQARPSNPWL